MRRGLGLEPGEWWGQGGAAGAAAGAGGASGLPAQSHLDRTPRAEDRGRDPSFCHGVRGSVPLTTQHCFYSASAALVLSWLLFAPMLWGPVVRQPQLPVVEGGGPPTRPAAPDVPAQGDGGKQSICFGAAWGASGSTEETLLSPWWLRNQREQEGERVRGPRAASLKRGPQHTHQAG